MNEPSESRYAASERLHAEATELIPGGVNSNYLLNSKPVPLFYKDARAAHLWDVDGNRYVDYVLGLGAVILGHDSEVVTRAITQGVQRGFLVAGQHVEELELARLIQRMVPCAAMSRLGASGSEAVQGALRMARAFTGRNKVAKFEGHFHGWFDNILFSMSGQGPDEAPATAPESAGIPNSSAQDVVVLPWNDIAAVQRCFETEPDLAALIMEPLPFNTVAVMPADGFLQRVRELCDKHGVVLIFDEVITGFRVARGGAQELLGVVPDVATFAKAMGNGMPISCIAGKPEILNTAVFGGLIHAGTYNGNRLSVLAAIATLSKLAEGEGAVYRKLNELGAQLMEGFRELAKKHRQPLHIRGVGSIFQFHFAPDAPASSLRDSIVRCRWDLLSQFTFGMLERGIRIVARGNMLLSAAHTPADIDDTLRAASSVFASL